MKPGIYETIYGNAAEVLSDKAETAYDLDMGERIPIDVVMEDKYIRPLD